MLTTVFFDLDDTLYPADSGVWQAIRERILRYMIDVVGIPADQADSLRGHYYRTYGTALRGLELHHPVDRDHYLAYVHDVPLTDFLAPNPELRAALLAVPQRRWIFTNADRAHADRVLRVLGVADCFEGVIDVQAVTPFCKPEPGALEIALRVAGGPDPARCALIDDLPRTVRAARGHGWFSVLYGRDDPGEDADAAFTRWADLPPILTGA